MSAAEVAHTVYNAYWEWCNKAEADILNWASHPLPYKAGATEAWPLSSFGTAFGIMIAYLLFVFLGSAILGGSTVEAGKKADEMYAMRFVYNLVQVFACSYMFIEAGTLAVRHGYTLTPDNPHEQTNPPIGNLLWVFYISKVLDFMDTIFIVFRRSWKQLSFLHVYHHSTIFMFYWLNLRVGYDGDIYFTILANGFVHAVMYTYYFVSMHTRDIWWKRHLTKVQLIQFCFMVCQATYKLVVPSVQPLEKQFPWRVTATYLVYITSLFVLFMQFYMASYKKPKGGKKPKKA